jgi:hypothetical protein
MSMTHSNAPFKMENLQKRLDDLKESIQTSVRKGRPAHEAERDFWQQLLQMGREAMGLFFHLQGAGDMGETVSLPTGEECQRLEEQHQRRYVSVFGEFLLWRAVYGSREKQKIEFVPLDHRLQLPESVFSYVLQDWDQSLCVDEAFGQAKTTMERILGLKQSVGSLEQMNQDMAKEATTFMLNRPVPEEEGEIVVASADQKGIVRRRSVDNPAPKAHRTKGEKARVKRMATVATTYTVDRYARTAEEVVAALFRDGVEPVRKRPEPQHQEVWASLPKNAKPGSGIDSAFAWMVGGLYMRGRLEGKPMVFLSDGQKALWEARDSWLPEGAIDILDLLHVTPRLWQAAHLFHKEGSPGAEAFVREHLLRVLQGKAEDVVRGLRAKAVEQKLSSTRKKRLTTVCNYLMSNRQRMRYDEYLREGYPIATGVVEGACRHLVKDRMERAGMHWTVPGAQAMLDVRSIFVSDAWQEYQSYRIESETERLYPFRAIIESDYQIAI